MDIVEMFFSETLSLYHLLRTLTPFFVVVVEFVFAAAVLGRNLSCFSAVL